MFKYLFSTTFCNFTSLLRFLSFIFLASLVSATGFVSCSSLQKKQSSQTNITRKEAKDILSKYKRAYSHLKNQNFKASATLFKDLEKEDLDPATRLAVKFNIGVSYEGLNKCSKAAHYYRESSRNSHKANPKIQAQSFLRLSYAYECLGADHKVLTALLDALKKRDHLSNTVVETEIPARLGAVYSRLGEKQMALKFFRNAESGLATVRNKNELPKDQLQELSKTLYFMGQINKRLRKKKNYLISATKLQKYLLQSTEIGDKIWSFKSFLNLTNYYESNWNLIKKSRLNKETSRFAKANINSINILYKSRFKKQQSSKFSKNVFKRVNILKRKFRKFLKSRK